MTENKLKLSRGLLFETSPFLGDLVVRHDFSEPRVCFDGRVTAESRIRGGGARDVLVVQGVLK